MMLEPDDEGFVDVNEIEGAGFIEDEYGNKWAVPADNVADLDDAGMVNPMAFPSDKKDPRFHYQWIRNDQWPEYQSLKFAKVTQSEMGRMPGMVGEFGKSASVEFLEFNGMVAVKCPLFIKEALDRQKEAARKLALEGTQPVERIHRGARGETVVERTDVDSKIGDEPGSAQSPVHWPTAKRRQRGR